MSQILTEVLDSNRKYASNFGEKSQLASPPARRFAILTCIDAGLTPPNTLASPRATLTSSAMPEAAPATMPFDPW